MGIVRAVDGAFPRDVASGVERAAGEMGFQVALTAEFEASDTEFGRVIRDICRAAPDVLVVVGRFQNDLVLAEMLAEAGPGIGAVAVVAAGVEAFRERLDDRADGFIGPSQWEPDTGYAVDFGPSIDEVRDSLRRAGHPVIDYPMAQAYAVGVVIQRCVEECGSPGGRGVAGGCGVAGLYDLLWPVPD